MRVEIHGHPYPRVSHHLLDHLRMFTACEHQRREAVAQGVKRDVWQIRAPEQWFEGATEDVVAIEGRSHQRGEHDRREVLKLP